MTVGIDVVGGPGVDAASGSCVTASGQRIAGA
jgi:hypothetical protein